MKRRQFIQTASATSALGAMSLMTGCATIGGTNGPKVVVVGGGIAGGAAALAAANAGATVAVLLKGDTRDSNTHWAQGGIAAVLDETDSLDAHVEDTLTAGAPGGVSKPMTTPDEPTTARPRNASIAACPEAASVPR